MSALPSSKPSRRYYLDWLRAGLLGLACAVHCIMPFNTADRWHIMNTDTTFVVTAIAGFCHQWGMPLFFFVSGAAACFSLRSRANGRFVSERFKRLMVPYFAAVLFLSPVQAYLQHLNSGGAAVPFLRFCVEFFRGAEFGFNLTFGLPGFHLWFLHFLFAFCVVALPLFIAFRSTRGVRFIERLAAGVARPATLLLGAAPIALTLILLKPKYPEYEGWMFTVYWFVFFVYGYVFAADTRFEAAVRRLGWWALVLGMACFASMGGLYAAGLAEPWERFPDYSIGCMLYAVLSGLNTWAWVLFLLFLGIRFLSGGGRWIGHVNEGALPFYILNHPVIVAVAFFVVQTPFGIPAKIGLIAVPSVVLPILGFMFLVRPFNPVRFVFGMPPRPRST